MEVFNPSNWTGKHILVLVVLAVADLLVFWIFSATFFHVLFVLALIGIGLFAVITAMSKVREGGVFDFNSYTLKDSLFLVLFFAAAMFIIILLTQWLGKMQWLSAGIAILVIDALAFRYVSKKVLKPA